MDFSDEMLMAYADQELDPAQRAAVEHAMASDPEIARRVAEHKALRARLHATYEPVLREEMPARLLDTVREQSQGRGENVIPLHRRTQRMRQSGWQWIALAASLLLGVVIGQFAGYPTRVGPFATRDGQLLARGELASALSQQLASTQNPHASVQLGVSYLAKDGEYCRTFTLTDRRSLAGLACRDARDWQVQMLVQSVSETAPGTQYRRAASAIPDAIARAVDAQISGGPLDAREEAAAKGSGWRLQSSH
jgi:hypothetical protein